MSFRPQEPRKYGVESPHPKITRVGTHYLFDPLPHFLGRLVGERQGHDVERINALTVNKVGNSKREYPCFAGTGPRNQHARSFGIDHPFALWFIQTIQIFLHKSGAI